ncbi:MAG: hypothetical protein J6C33_05575 [Lachnospiraceae bacterium]|nr:hypothetical protein [Lachnospiraceae bacterium]
MSKFVRLCEACKSKSNENSSLRGCGYSIYLKEDEYICEVCGNKVIDLKMSSTDYDILTEISSDPKFIESMIKLQESDIVEYNLKMSQFRNQVQQQEQTKEKSKPHCPTCGSTNIKPITGTERAASIIGLGIFSKKINKTYKCLNCKSTW